MSSVATRSDSALITELDVFFDGIFAPLNEWIPALAEQLRARKGDSFHGQQLAALIEPAAHAILEYTERPLYGAGFCASTEVVTEGNPLAWWQGPERLQLSSSTFGPSQSAIDLGRLEWYRVPAETGSEHIAGPFVDYLCSNEITMTCTKPVNLDGEFVGVVCADVLVASLENLLLPMLQRIGAGVLVNADGRVVVSTSIDYETGDRFVAQTSAYAQSSKYPFSMFLV